MKKYSSNRAQKGKTAYRTPSLFRANKAISVADMRGRVFLDKPFKKKNVYANT